MNPEFTLISLQLKGLLDTEERGGISRIREILDSRYLSGRVNSSGLRPSPRDTGWMESLPPGMMRK